MKYYPSYVGITISHYCTRVPIRKTRSQGFDHNVFLKCTIQIPQFKEILKSSSFFHPSPGDSSNHGSLQDSSCICRSSTHETHCTLETGCSKSCAQSCAKGGFTTQTWRNSTRGQGEPKGKRQSSIFLIKNLSVNLRAMEIELFVYKEF